MGELLRPVRRIVGVGVLGDLDAQRLTGGVCTPELGAVKCANGDAACATGQDGRVAVELGNGANAREPAISPGYEHDVRGCIAR